ARADQGKKSASRAARVRERQRDQYRSSARLLRDRGQPRPVSRCARPHRRRQRERSESGGQEVPAQRPPHRRVVHPEWWSRGMTTDLQKGIAAGRHVLGNGTVVISKEARTVPAVTIQVGVRAGSIYDSNALLGLSHLTSRVLDRGTREKSTEQIAEALDERGVSLSVGANRHVMSVNCTCLAEDFEAMLELVGEIVMQPAFPEEEIVKRKGEVANAIRQDEDSPAAMAML